MAEQQPVRDPCELPVAELTRDELAPHAVDLIHAMVENYVAVEGAVTNAEHKECIGFLNEDKARLVEVFKRMMEPA